MGASWVLLGGGCATVAEPTDQAPIDVTDTTGTEPDTPTDGDPTADTGPTDTGTKPAPPERGVVLLAGQSNMAGRASDAQLPALLQGSPPDVQLYYSGGGRLPANGLIPLEPGSGTAFGPEITVGHALTVLEPDESYVLVKHAVGGTNLFDDWDPKTGAEYATLLSTTNQALRDIRDQGFAPRIDGILWVQGEADAVQGRSEAEYAADLTELVAALRADVAGGSNVRFVVGRLSDAHFEPNATLVAARDEVRAAQEQVADTVANVALVDTDDLSLQDDRHYDPLAQQGLGTRLARALFPGRQTSSVARFDFGLVGQSAEFELEGWTPVQLPDNTNPVRGVAVDAATGWTVAVDPATAASIGRNRAPLDAKVGASLTFGAVYVDFVTGWETMTVGGLDPARTYDVQVIMYDDNGQAGRTQTLTHTTGGIEVELGTSEGPGGSNELTDDLAFSVFGAGLAPDAAGTLTFRCANSATGNRCLTNGVVLTEL